MGVTRTIEQIARGIEALGIATLVSGLAVAVVRAANILIHGGVEKAPTRTLRTVFGRSILLDLSFWLRPTSQDYRRQTIPTMTSELSEKTFVRGPGPCVRRVWTSRPSLVSAPSDLAGVGVQHPEHDPHGGGLVGAVGADEPERLPLAKAEWQAVEGDHVAVVGGSASAIPTRRPTHSGSRLDVRVLTGTLAAGPVGGVRPGEEPGVLLGSYRVGLTTAAGHHPGPGLNHPRPT
jgi:hypothetical protein